MNTNRVDTDQPDPTDNRHVSRPKPGFLQERGREIVAGVIILVIAAALIGGGSAILNDDDNGPAPTPELPGTVQAALGNWDFVRYEGRAPSLPPGPCIQPSTLSLLANHTFTASVVLCDTGELFGSQAGEFEALDENTIELRNDSDSSVIGVHDLAVNDNELLMTDQGTGTTVVYQRRQG